MTPKEVLDMARENGAKVIDLRFMDFPGLWQHFSVPVRELEESSFEDGFGFDGSSIRGQVRRLRSNARCRNRPAESGRNGHR